MYRKISWAAVAAAIFLVPAAVRAGGPPWLCLPIDGATAEKTAAAQEPLEKKLAGKMWNREDSLRGVKFQQYRDQSYLVFHLADEVSLADVDAALKGSGLSIPRDKLHLFGHVILQIDPRKTPEQELVAALKAIEHVSVEKSESKDGMLRVTVAMPYPKDHEGVDRATVGWDTFVHQDFSAAGVAQTGSQAMAKQLPSYDDLRQVIEKHDAKLKDIVWSQNFACRPLGCVTAPALKTSASAVE